MAQNKQQEQGIIPTTQWMRTAYDFFNKRYFNGQLGDPIFKAEKDCRYNGEEVWGYFDANIETNWSGTKVIRVNRIIGNLALSTKYRRLRKSVEETLLHEMVHAYVYTVLKVLPRNPHGKEFMAKANEINADGWNISERTEMMSTDTLADGTEQGATDFNEGGGTDAVCVYYQYNGKAYFIKVDAHDTNFSKGNLTSHGAKNVTIKKLNHRGLDYFPTSTKDNIVGLEADIDGKYGWEKLLRVIRNYFGNKMVIKKDKYKIQKQPQQQQATVTEAKLRKLVREIIKETLNEKKSHK